MAGSSIIVALNAVALKRLRLPPHPEPRVRPAEHRATPGVPGTRILQVENRA